jgi:hypothetical protein
MQRLDAVDRPERIPLHVELLTTEPARPHKVVAIVTTSSADRSLPALRKRLINEAARLGGNALLFDGDSVTRTEKGLVLTAKVIVYDRQPAF